MKFFKTPLKYPWEPITTEEYQQALIEESQNNLFPGSWDHFVLNNEEYIAEEIAIEKFTWFVISIFVYWGIIILNIT
jgi:hypothetical protein